MKSSFRVLAGASCAALTLVAAGCGSSAEETPTTRVQPGDATATPVTRPSATPTTPPTSVPPASQEVVIKITVGKDSVSPSAERREIKLGQPVVFAVDAVRAGQLHVHSKPEKLIDYPAGTSEITVKFPTPGVFDVEDHDLDELIVQLEVS